MYNVLCSKIEVLPQYKNDLKKIVSAESKVVILPWTFATELKSLDEFFSKNSPRYTKYINSLKEIGIKEKNIIVLNCYKDSKDRIKQLINNADVIVLTGGNPEMLYSKVVQDTECLYELKHFKGVVIGSSAGAELQLRRYFITKKNNYYKTFSFYDGFGIINNNFYLDVHTINNGFYLKKLQRVSNETKKIIYAMSNDDLIIYNRENNKFKLSSNVKVFSPRI